MRKIILASIALLVGVLAGGILVGRATAQQPPPQYAPAVRYQYQCMTKWDGEGRRYLDLVAAYGACNVGHSHPRLLARLRGALDERPYHFLHFGLGGAQEELAEALARRAGPLSMTLFANSGSEAIEAAMK